MRELRIKEIGDRRVALVECDDGHYDVTIAVRTVGSDWQDISLRADMALTFDIARGRYRQRVIEQQTRGSAGGAERGT